LCEDGKLVPVSKPVLLAIATKYIATKQLVQNGAGRCASHEKVSVVEANQVATLS
jgi:hypothetical protein